MQPNGTQLLVWLGCAALVLAGVSFLLMIFNQSAKARQTLSGKKEKMNISPQPLLTREVSGSVTEKDCEARHASISAQLVELRKERISDATKWDESRERMSLKIDAITNQLPEMERRLNKADEDRTTAVHNRVNDILEAVSELRGEVRKII